MKFTIRIEGDIRALLQREKETGKLATSAAMASVGRSVKAAWRAQVVAAGLGDRLANTVRDKVYPEDRPSLNTAAFIYTRASEIMAAHDEGALIRARYGLWISIPLPTAGKGAGGGQISPGEWQFKTGKKLVFIQTNATKAVLAAEDVRVNTRGIGVRDRRRVRRGASRQSTLVPIFVLVRKVKLPKRLNIAALADQGVSLVASRIVNNWKD